MKVEVTYSNFDGGEQIDIYKNISVFGPSERDGNLYLYDFNQNTKAIYPKGYWTKVRIID